MPQSPEHICWGKEPWFAWDLWNAEPGAELLFDLMLNGGFAMVERAVSIQFGDQEHEAVLPMVAELDPAIGDFMPIDRDVCGLWVVQIFSNDTVESYENENGLDYGAWTQPHVSDAHQIMGEGLGCFYRPWDIVPLPDVTEDDCWDVDEVHQWISEHVVFANGRSEFRPDSLANVAATYQVQVRKQRETWMHFLASMADRHECADLMHDELVSRKESV